jgi:hypothetical protein
MVLSPEMASSVVDFPLPLAPRRTIIWPLRALILKSLTAMTVSGTGMPIFDRTFALNQLGVQCFEKEERMME